MLVFILWPFFAGVSSAAPQISLTASITGSEAYDDNIFLDPEDEESDFITSVQVAVGSEILWRRAGIQLDYGGSRFWYRDNDDENYWRNLATGTVWYDISRNTRFEVRNTYLRTSNPYDQSGLLNPNAPLGGQDVDQDLNRQGLETYYVNVTSANLTHQFGPRDNAALDYSYSVQRNINATPINPNEEHDISTVSGALTYWFLDRWGTDVNGFFSNRNLEFDEDRDVYDGTGRLLYEFSRHFNGFLAYRHLHVDYKDEITAVNYTVYQPEIGIFYQFEENSYTRIGLGYFIQDRDSTNNPLVDDSDSQGFVVNSETYKAWPFQRGSISILTLSGYEQDDTGAEDNGLNIYYQGRLGGEYTLLRRLTAEGYFQYRWDDYPDLEESRTDKTIVANAGLSYQPFQWMTTRLDYTFRDRDSDDEINEYTANEVVFSITIAPTRPFRLFR